MEKFIQVLALPRAPTKYKTSPCIVVSLQPWTTSEIRLPVTPVSTVANHWSTHLPGRAFVRPPLIKANVLN